MAKYLIRLTPLDFYFFGDENAFHYTDDGQKINGSYYATSLSVPPQTSIIGMLRYTVLEQMGLLKAGRRYSAQEKAAVDAAVGDAGYCVEKENSFGVIKDMSPLFIMDETGNKYIQTPFNHKAPKKTDLQSTVYYTPMEISTVSTETNHGEHGKIFLPSAGEFNAKKTVGLSYMKLSDRSIHDDLFTTDERVGIDKVKKDEAYVRKLYCKLKDGYSFAVYAEFEGFEPKNSICYMGREKSVFRFDVERIAFDGPSVDEEFVRDIKNAIKGDFCYAASDLIIKKKLIYGAYAVTSVGGLRTLTSSYDKDNRLWLKRNEKFYNVIKAGSVFYGRADGIKEYFYSDGFGLNKIIDLGGN